MMTTSYLPEAHERVQRDLMDSEREQRRTAEALARELVKVLQELAILLDGARLESLRRLDPGCPQYWTPEDWRQFFAGIPGSAGGSGWSQAETPRVGELERSLAELKERLAETEARLAAPLPGGPAEPADLRPLPEPARFEVSDGMTPPVGSLLERARETWSLLPVTCPAAFRSVLSGKGRTGEDLKKAYRRSWLCLYLIGTFCLNATLEIDGLLALAGGLSSRAGSLNRILDELVESGLLLAETLRINTPRTCLRLVRLSPAGRQLFQILFDQEPRQSDWERLAGHHPGEPFPEHGLAVLIFALHARKRGRATRLLPPVENTPASPDLLVQNGQETCYLRVELGPAGHPAEWPALAELNQGKVALGAATPEARMRLARECRQAGLAGRATDLETLIKARYGSITADTPLWAETW